jgi:hypothetical protein
MVDNRPEQNATPPDSHRPDFVTPPASPPRSDQPAVDEPAIDQHAIEQHAVNPPDGDPELPPDSISARDDVATAEAVSAEAAADSEAERPPHEPQVIDLPPTDFSDAEPLGARAGSEPPAAPPRSVLASTLLPGVSGAVAAAILLGVLWIVAVPLFPAPPATTAPDTAAVDALSARVAAVESRAPVAAPPDPAIVQRIDALEKSVAALRPNAGSAPAPAAAAPDPALTGRLAALETALTALRDDVASRTQAPAAAAAAAPGDELASLEDRLSQLEAAAKNPAPAPAPVAATPAIDDTPLRRVVAATLLELSVRQGTPYEALLKVAQPLAGDAGALKPLEPFAVAGVPSAVVLSRELIALLPKLSPGQETSGVGLLDRLQAGADRMVRIQRPDGIAGPDRIAILSRVSAAAHRNDLAEARKELAALAPAERAPAQPWIEKAEARDAALAASRQFAAAALAALPKPQ